MEMRLIVYLSSSDYCEGGEARAAQPCDDNQGVRPSVHRNFLGGRSEGGEIIRPFTRHDGVKRERPRTNSLVP